MRNNFSLGLIQNIQTNQINSIQIKFKLTSMIVTNWLLWFVLNFNGSNFESESITVVTAFFFTSTWCSILLPLAWRMVNDWKFMFVNAKWFKSFTDLLNNVIVQLWLAWHYLSWLSMAEKDALAGPNSCKWIVVSHHHLVVLITESTRHWVRNFHHWCWLTFDEGNFAFDRTV